MKGKRMRSLTIAVAAFLATSRFAAADTLEVHSITAKGVGPTVGTVTISATSGVVSFVPDLKGFKPGRHAFHVHENPDCGPGMANGKPVAGLAAGGHYMGSQHAAMSMPGMAHDAMPMAGDLPDLLADKNGAITKAVEKKGLTLAELHGKSLMIHRDASAKAGGGARIACAVIP